MEQGLSGRRRWLAIVALSCGNCVASVDSSILNVALPTIARELRVAPAATPLVVSTYQLVLLMTVLPFAALGEKFGLKRLYLAGLALFAAAGVCSALAPSLAALVATRALQAIGAAAILSISPALVRYVYPPERLAAGLALNSFIVTTAAMLAPALGGAVLAVATWRWIFLVATPLVLGSLAFGSALPPTHTHDDPYDFRGAAVSAATFLLLIGGVQMAIHGVSPMIWGASMLAGGVIGLKFLQHERRSARPMFPVDLFAQPVIAVSVLGGFCVYALSQSVMLNMPFRLQHVFGFSPVQVGAVLSTWPFALVLTVPLSGYFSNRAPPGLLGAIGMATSFTGLVALSFLPAKPGYFDLAWRLWLCGAGIGMFLAPNNRLIIGSAPAHRLGGASGLIATVRMTGQTLGATTAALMLALGVGLGRAPTLVGAGLTAVAFACCLAHLRPARREV
jgi:DHA2 family multidrug resistance protein-like MFS transporter